MKIKYYIVLSLLAMQMAFGEAPPPQQSKTITPSARTCSSLDGVYITGAFTYWRAREDDQIHGAFANFNIDFTTGDLNLDAKPFEHKFQYDPGFKIGVGGDLPFDGWDLYLNWTRFHSYTSTRKSSNTPEIIQFFGSGFGERVGPPILGQLFRSSWNLRFDSLDFDWGRRFFLSKTLTLRPSFGGKTVWINQTYRSALSNTEVFFVEIPANTETYKLKNDFWGIGPYGACEGKWTLGWGFGVCGQISTSLLWGKFDHTSHLIENLFTNQLEILDRKIKFSTHRLRPTMQLFVGLDWEWCFIENWLSVNLRAGYESQYFWSQLLNASEDFGESDLTFEGLTFTGRIDF